MHHNEIQTPSILMQLRFPCKHVQLRHTGKHQAGRPKEYSILHHHVEVSEVKKYSV